MPESRKNPEARKMLVNRAESHTSGARFVGRVLQNVTHLLPNHANNATTTTSNIISPSLTAVVPFENSLEYLRGGRNEALDIIELNAITVAAPINKKKPYVLRKFLTLSAYKSIFVK